MQSLYSTAPANWAEKDLKNALDNIMLIIETKRGARGVVVIVVGNGHGDTSSNPGRD